MKRKKNLFSQWFLFSWKDLFISAAILLCAVCFCIFLQSADTTEGFASPIFVLAVLLISRFTSGYLFGSIAAVLGVIFTDLFRIHGAVMESSESLLYAGYQNLDLTLIFMASIFLGSSGAVMDLSVDICSAVHEVVEKRPDIGPREAIASGFAVGRAACGSTTTTLLLAYSGSYVALLMVFMAQGTPVEFILNYKYVAAEIAHTVVGSFGLVTVAPLTAITSGLLLTRRTAERTSP